MTTAAPLEVRSLTKRFQLGNERSSEKNLVGAAAD